MRGFVLGGNDAFLDPYHAGVSRCPALRSSSSMRWRATRTPESSRADLAAVRRAIDAWETDVRRADDGADPPARRRARRTPPRSAAGKARFDAVRTALARLRGDLQAERVDARARARERGEHAHAVPGVRGRAAAGRGAGRRRDRPPGRRAADRTAGRAGARRRRRGAAPRDPPRAARATSSVSVEDVESMRERIVRELEVLRVAEAEIHVKALALERSNAELEQFAYVASHDLQEPLRKVTSFCQMLERRYAGQLDERGEQYIAFAVDGAKRMQALINDLLAFSRVGRIERPRELVDMGELVAHTAARLGLAIEEAGRHRRGRRAAARGLRGADAAAARVPEPDRQRDQVPRRRAAARARVGAPRRRRTGSFAVADNGIGIDPRVRRAHLRHLPAPAPQGRLRRDRDRAGACAARSSSTTEGTSGCRPARTATGRPSASPCRCPTSPAEEAVA